MDTYWKTSIWQQFGAAIDTLDNAIIACPDELWDDRTKQPEYWAVVHHTLFWLDFYLSESPEGFAPPAPFGLEELDPAGVLPERPYTKDELRTYLRHDRQKCRETIETLTEEKALRPYKFVRVDLTFGELLLYSMRHVQHGAAQLNLILRQSYDMGSPWVFRAKNVDKE